MMVLRICYFRRAFEVHFIVGVHMHTMYCGVRGGQKKALKPQELELQIVVGYQMGAGHKI